MGKVYRRGAVGALMDEYERAGAELAQLIAGLTEAEFQVVRDRQTTDEECRSIQTVVHHVVRAGYGYAHYLRTALSEPSKRTEIALSGREESIAQLEAMLVDTAAALEVRWEMPDEEIAAVEIRTRWGPTYDLEQMLEHAIVHVLRHRRQIERFLCESQFAPEHT